MPRNIDVCAVADVAAGTMHVIQIDDTDILLVNLDGAFRAVQASCSHEEAGLDTGELDGDVITCSLHWSAFDVTTGDVIDPPAELPLVVFPVSIEGDRVVLEVPDGPIAINVG